MRDKLAAWFQARFRVPTSAVGQFFFFGISEAVCFAVLVANTRAVAQGSYFWTAITDAGFGLQSFIVFKLAVDDKNGRTWAAGLGTTVGGVCGSLVSIFVTKHLYGQ